MSRYMVVRQHYLNNIQDRFAFLQSRVKNTGSLNLNDIRIIAEDFYKDLFNHLGIFGTEFENLNEQQVNADYIDLIDMNSRTALQITAENNSQKITHTITGFFNKPEMCEFNLKLVLIGKEAKDYRKDFTVNGTYNFDISNDIIDIPKLISLIKDNFDTLERISKFLDKQILLPCPQTELNEVETIMSLLEFLSDDNNYREFDGNYECDPEKKINSKFKEYASTFTSEFMELFPVYSNTIPEAKKTFGLDGVRAVKISNFLNYISNRFLVECENQAINALYKLTDYFSGQLSKNGIKADNGAIRYYLLEELIGCNIFSTLIG